MSDEEEKPKPLAGCMIPRTKGRTQRTRTEDSDSEDEGTELVCNMTGRSRESLPFPVIIDPGACAPVMKTSWCNHVPLQGTPQSRSGEYYRAANGNRIYHEGERAVSTLTQE